MIPQTFLLLFSSFERVLALHSIIDSFCVQTFIREDIHLISLGILYNFNIYLLGPHLSSIHPFHNFHRLMIKKTEVK